MIVFLFGFTLEFIEINIRLGLDPLKLNLSRIRSLNLHFTYKKSVKL